MWYGLCKEYIRDTTKHHDTIQWGGVGGLSRCRNSQDF